MNNVMPWIKAHPYSTGAIVLGGLLVFVMFSGWFSGSGEGTADGGLSDAEIAANATIAAAQINAQASAQQAGMQIQLAQIGAGVQMNSDNLSAATAIRLAELQKELGLAEVDANKAIGLAQVTAEQKAAEAKAKAEADAAKANASAQKSAAKSSGIGNAIGAIATAAMFIFCDERLKRNVIPTGKFTKAGAAIYQFNYVWDGDNTKVRYGPMAADVARLNPSFVRRHFSGYWQVHREAMT